MSGPFNDSLSWRTCVKMTRPGFLVITLVACLLGTSIAMASGYELSIWRALSTLLLALLMHAAANVLNDYYDAINGADQANLQGLFPFTGGTRFIQNGVVTVAQTLKLAFVLMLMVVPLGLLFAIYTGGGLLVLGALGLLFGWAYSAPPLALMTRGMGELTVGFTWLLVVVGADYVQRGNFVVMPFAAALSYGVLIANILVINAFPDAPADAQVGKSTLVVRMGRRTMAFIYLGLVLFAHTFALTFSAWSLTSLPLSLTAAFLLFINHEKIHNVASLKSAILLTIAASVVHGLSLSAGYIFYPPHLLPI